MSASAREARSNTPHLVFDRLQPRAPRPLISIVDAACAAASRAGYTCVGLLGTRFTMAGSVYPTVFAASKAMLLAGTELPLLLRDTPAACPFLDTTAIHVDAAVDRLLAESGQSYGSV
jgi:aspartate/glutamate racemase